MNFIPEIYPETLEECLLIFEKITYESSGFPMFLLDYNYFFKYWSMSFRNPKNFSDPNIKEETPLKACFKMLDFLKSLEKK